jgi:hypothetical protein
MISLFSLFTAGWGLHLRMKSAQAHWKEEAVMVRRRSMALVAAGASGSSTVAGSEAGNDKARWSEVPEYNQNNSFGRRGSMVKDPNINMGEEERLEASLNEAKRNSREQVAMINRAS